MHSNIYLFEGYKEILGVFGVIKESQKAAYSKIKARNECGALKYNKLK